MEACQDRIDPLGGSDAAGHRSLGRDPLRDHPAPAGVVVEGEDDVIKMERKERHRDVGCRWRGDTEEGEPRFVTDKPRDPPLKRRQSGDRRRGKISQQATEAVEGFAHRGRRGLGAPWIRGRHEERVDWIAGHKRNSSQARRRRDRPIGGFALDDRTVEEQSVGRGGERREDLGCGDLGR